MFMNKLYGFRTMFINKLYEFRTMFMNKLYEQIHVDFFKIYEVQKNYIPQNLNIFSKVPIA